MMQESPPPEYEELLVLITYFRINIVYDVTLCDVVHVPSLP
jgi:hypothetical protein